MPPLPPTTTIVTISLAVVTLATLYGRRKHRQQQQQTSQHNTTTTTRLQHIKPSIAYFRMLLLRSVPSSAQSQDVNRTTLCYFTTSALDLLGEPLLGIQTTLEDNERKRVIEWIYSRQHSAGGFDGGPFDGPNPVPGIINGSHIVATYSALTTLLVLGDNLSRVRRKELLSWMRTLQDEDGCFHGTITVPTESDLRFLYAACAISTLLHDFSAIDVTRASTFCYACLCYDGGFSMRPGLESHGGAAYTATASLFLMNRLDILSPRQLESLIRFCVCRQGDGEQQDSDGGFNGRIHKKLDTCYAFWVGAVFIMLRCSHFINTDGLHQFLDSTAAHKVGGYGKHPDEFPDPLHSYFGIWARTFCDNPAAADPLAVALGLSTRAMQKWKTTL